VGLLRRAFDGEADVVDVPTCDALPDAVAAHALTRVAVIPARTSAGLASTVLVRRLRTASPGVAIVVAAAADASLSHAIMALGAAGVHGFLFPDQDTSALVVRHALASARSACAAEVILRAIGDVIPSGLRDFVSMCLTRPQEVSTVSRAAVMIGVHRRTLFHRCRDLADGFGAEELLSWCRVLLAAHMLRDQHRTVESIALELDASSVTGLRNLLKRYTGMSASELRKQGGLPVAVQAFRRRLIPAATAKSDGAS